MYHMPHIVHMCAQTTDYRGKLGVATKRRNEITPLIKVVQLSLTPQGLKEKLIKGFFF